MDVDKSDCVVPNAIAIERVIRDLNDIERRAGWQRVELVARVIERHFPGSVSQVSRPMALERSTSLRELCRHRDCPLSKSQLHGMLSAYAVYVNDPFVKSSDFLTPSHVAVVATLGEVERATLLRSAHDNRTSVRELCLLVRAIRRSRGEKRGRPPKAAPEKAITRFENAILSLEEGNALISKHPIDEQNRLHLLRLLDRAYALFKEGMESVLGRQAGRSAAPIRPPSARRAQAALHAESA